MPSISMAPVYFLPCSYILQEAPREISFKASIQVAFFCCPTHALQEMRYPSLQAAQYFSHTALGCSTPRAPHPLLYITCGLLVLQGLWVFSLAASIQPALICSTPHARATHSSSQFLWPFIFVFGRPCGSPACPPALKPPHFHHPTCTAPFLLAPTLTSMQALWESSLAASIQAASRPDEVEARGVAHEGLRTGSECVAASHADLTAPAAHQVCGDEGLGVGVGLLCECSLCGMVVLNNTFHLHYWDHGIPV